MNSRSTTDPAATPPRQRVDPNPFADPHLPARFPGYTPEANITNLFIVAVCGDCGCPVVNQAQHDRFHRRVDL